jgi:hypothetical protein
MFKHELPFSTYTKKILRPYITSHNHDNNQLYKQLAQNRKMHLLI